TADFDPGAGTVELSAVVGWPGDDVFVSKLDSSGNYVWAKSFGGTKQDVGNSVAVDSSGNVYTTGFFQGTADFDPGAGTTNLTTTGPEVGDDVFVSKLDSAGDLLWVKGFGGAEYSFYGPDDRGYSVALDSSGNVYITGQFLGTVDFDPGAGTTEFTSSEYSFIWRNDVFVLRLDSTGNLGTVVPAGFTLSTTTVSVAETGTTAQFTVVLDAEPVSDVVIWSASSDSGEAQVGAQLTFTSSNWATPQAFTITGVDDDVDDGDQQATFTVGVL
ncbi:uncharacterized protein METZ01_LOCUS422239, partial [marine metagenome]